ncbi:hypothetical protein D3C72_1053130 [compost metagenome]
MTRQASAKVTMIWLVTVKKYGNMPSRFAVSTNMNSENTNGKNTMPFLPAPSRSMEAMNS